MVTATELSSSLASVSARCPEAAVVKIASEGVETGKEKWYQWSDLVRER
jgi:hypothetical protein